MATGGSCPSRWCWRSDHSGVNPSSAGRDREGEDMKRGRRRVERVGLTGLTYAAYGDSVTLLHDVTGLIVLSEKTEEKHEIDGGQVFTK